MGIPRLFSWLYRYHPQCLISILKGETLQSHGIQVDGYALDNNAIIHPVCQKMYRYGAHDPKNNPRLLHRSTLVVEPPSTRSVYAEICATNIRLCEKVNPTSSLLLAIDGVAGLSKQTQQRQRRFSSAKTSSPNSVFDSNCITCGSEFMDGLSRYTHYNIMRQLEVNPNWQNLRVHFSNERVVGEGEHNIIQHIRSHPSESWCVHSPDADLLMLTLSLTNPQIYILRENIYKSIQCEYFLVDVNVFRTTLLSLLRWSSVTHVYNPQSAIYDFIFICFLLGNDFLPHIPSLEISEHGLDLLLAAYPRICSNHGHLVYRAAVGGALSVNTQSLAQLFYHLSLQESDRLATKARDRSVTFPDTILIANMTDTDNPTLNFSQYKTDYYEKKLHGSDPADVSYEYIRGMVFVLRYYIDGIPDWHYFYPFHYAPLFTDLYRTASDFPSNPEFTQNTPLSPFEQLLAVLPPSSNRILPECLRELTTSTSSPISDFYPTDFTTDLDGRRQEWEGSAILPFISVDRLQLAYTANSHNLTESQRARGVVGRNTVYYREGGRVCTRLYS